MFKIVKSNTNKDQIFCDGFIYRNQKKNSWICHKYKCSACFSTSGDGDAMTFKIPASFRKINPNKSEKELVEAFKDHLADKHSEHDIVFEKDIAVINEKQILKRKCAITETAATTKLVTMYREASAKLLASGVDAETVAEYFPAYNKLRSTLNRRRRRGVSNNAMPKLMPQSSLDKEVEEHSLERTESLSSLSCSNEQDNAVDHDQCSMSIQYQQHHQQSVQINDEATLLVHSTCLNAINGNDDDDTQQKLYMLRFFQEVANDLASRPAEERAALFSLHAYLASLSKSVDPKTIRISRKNYDDQEDKRG